MAQRQALVEHAVDPLPVLLGLAGVRAERPKPTAYPLDRSLEVLARHLVGSCGRERVGVAEQPVDALAGGVEFGDVVECRDLLNAGLYFVRPR